GRLSISVSAGPRRRFRSRNASGIPVDGAGLPPSAGRNPRDPYTETEGSPYGPNAGPCGNGVMVTAPPSAGAPRSFEGHRPAVAASEVTTHRPAPAGWAPRRRCAPAGTRQGAWTRVIDIAASRGGPPWHVLSSRHRRGAEPELRSLPSFASFEELPVDDRFA